MVLVFLCCVSKFDKMNSWSTQPSSEHVKIKKWYGRSSTTPDLMACEDLRSKANMLHLSDVGEIIKPIFRLACMVLILKMGLHF